MATGVMPWFLAALGRMFQSRLGQWVAGALSWFGLVISSQKVVVEPLIDRVLAALPGLPADAVQWFVFLRLEFALTMILSAYSVRMALRGIRAMLVRKLS